MKKVISIPNAPRPLGPYSQAILIDSTLYVSGQIPLNPLTGELVLNSIQDSTKQVMENIKSLLKASNMSFDEVVKCSIFLSDMNTFAKVNQVYATYFEQIPPARETVEVSKLPMDVNIEISCIAVKNKKT